jgi:hypothetical protein
MGLRARLDKTSGREVPQQRMEPTLPGAPVDLRIANTRALFWTTLVASGVDKSGLSKLTLQLGCDDTSVAVSVLQSRNAFA